MYVYLHVKWGKWKKVSAHCQCLLTYSWLTLDCRATLGFIIKGSFYILCGHFCSCCHTPSFSFVHMNAFSLSLSLSHHTLYHLMVCCCTLSTRTSHPWISLTSRLWASGIALSFPSLEAPPSGAVSGGLCILCIPFLDILLIQTHGSLKGLDSWTSILVLPCSPPFSSMMLLHVTHCLFDVHQRMKFGEKKINI